MIIYLVLGKLLLPKIPDRKIQKPAVFCQVFFNLFEYIQLLTLFRDMVEYGHTKDGLKLPEFDPMRTLHQISKDKLTLRKQYSCLSK